MTWNKDAYEKHNVIKWHELGYKGQNVNVALLDFFKKDESHGRHMNYILQEVSPLANIIKLQDGLDESIDYIVEHKNEIDIVNCSFGSKLPFYFLKKMKDLGIPIIAASGNEHKNNVNMPASFDFTIAIGEYSNRFNKVVDRSNKGEKLDAVNEGYFFFWNDFEKASLNGTSSATAYTTAMVSLLLSWSKEQGLKLNNEQIRKFIHENSVDLYDEGHDYTSGYGLFILPNKLPERWDFMFPDIQDHWVEEEDVKLVAKHGLIKGDENGNFLPDRTITRAEYTTVLARLLRLMGKE